MTNEARKPRVKAAQEHRAPALAVAQAVASYGPVGAFTGDPADIIRNMRSGTFADIIPGLAARLGVTQDGLFRLLRLPHSTMKARISKNDTLSSSEQDRLYRTEKVLARTLAVLEDAPSARAWLVQENRSLGGEAPLSLLDTEAGYELVLDTLGRIEYGVVA
ncbi:type II RES/Xre toxin-antitoxin system antitoxin [Massilia sp. S19_KUP03_FR1]|uniref:type II RES/Xre toxin-antitoxin system antitoxin n=1 Tax=Massilia sp. S19_KUP03_FR1 TaxID=3025503 RepID=UPI002FCCCED9